MGKTREYKALSSFLERTHREGGGHARRGVLLRSYTRGGYGKNLSSLVGGRNARGDPHFRERREAHLKGGGRGRLLMRTREADPSARKKKEKRKGKTFFSRGGETPRAGST